MLAIRSGLVGGLSSRVKREGGLREDWRGVWHQDGFFDTCGRGCSMGDEPGSGRAARGRANGLDV